jgi:hypothetical protein
LSIARRERNFASRVSIGFVLRVALMDEILIASQNFRSAKAHLLAIEIEYRRLCSDDAARAVEAAIMHFDLARLALRQATRNPALLKA